MLMFLNYMKTSSNTIVKAAPLLWLCHHENLNCQSDAGDTVALESGEQVPEPFNFGLKQQFLAQKAKKERARNENCLDDYIGLTAHEVVAWSGHQPSAPSCKCEASVPITCGVVGARKGHKKKETSKMFEALGDTIYVLDGEDGSVDSVSFTILGCKRAKARPQFTRGRFHNPRDDDDAAEGFKAARDPGDTTTFGSKLVKVTTVAKFERAVYHFKRGGMELHGSHWQCRQSFEVCLGCHEWHFV